MVIWKRDSVSTLSKLEYLPTGYVSPVVDDLHGVLITFRMGKYLRCDHHAAFGSPTGFVLVSGAHAFMVVFVLGLTVSIGIGVGFPCWLHFRAHSRDLRWWGHIDLITTCLIMVCSNAMLDSILCVSHPYIRRDVPVVTFHLRTAPQVTVWSIM